MTVVLFGFLVHSAPCNIIKSLFYRNSIRLFQLCVFFLDIDIFAIYFFSGFLGC